MKHLIKLVILVMVVSFGGCYTVLWSPQEQLPAENSAQIYYSEPYYGDYNYYYDNPWWITGRPIYAVPPGEIQSSERSGAASVDRNTNVTTTRDDNGSRNAPDNSGSVIKTGTPTRNTNSSNNDPVYKNNRSNNSGEQTRSSENSRSNEGNNSARNNNGNRNSGNGRR